MSSIKDTLIFAPHADDEVLGCFSFLKPETHIIYIGIEDRSYVSRTQRLKEIENSAKKSGFSWDALNNKVNGFNSSELISVLEEYINSIKPKTVLIPQPSYNQDHRAVYDAAVTALRPHDKNWFVNDVLIFEQPDSVLWFHGNEKDPTFFCEIDIEDKIDSYLLYASQVREHRSPEIIRAMARLRGAQCGCSFAEGFTLKRSVKRKQ
jgi:LmbE family N-acetylglucosaminyl deacetylase